MRKHKQEICRRFRTVFFMLALENNQLGAGGLIQFCKFATYNIEIRQTNEKEFDCGSNLHGIGGIYRF